VRSRAFRLVYAILCTVLAAGCLWLVVDEWLLRRRTSAIVVFAAFCLLFLSTGVSSFRRWRATAWLAGASGSLLILYALSVVTMGWEDVGGARGALPLAIPTAIAGAWSILVAISTRLESGNAV
jgi:hypothetical protein